MLELKKDPAVILCFTALALAVIAVAAIGKLSWEMVPVILGALLTPSLFGRAKTADEEETKP